MWIGPATLRRRPEDLYGLSFGNGPQVLPWNNVGVYAQANKLATEMGRYMRSVSPF